MVENPSAMRGIPNHLGHPRVVSRPPLSRTRLTEFMTLGGKASVSVRDSASLYNELEGLCGSSLAWEELV